MDHSYQWEFPGGKVIDQESDEAAIQREIKEETHLEVETLKKLTPIHWQYPDKKIVLVPIICEIRLGTLELTEHMNHVWAKIEDMEKMNVLGADREVVKLLKKVYEN